MKIAVIYIYAHESCELFVISKRLRSLWLQLVMQSTETLYLAIVVIIGLSLLTQVSGGWL